MTRSFANFLAVAVPLILSGAPHMAADGLMRILAGLPSMSFAPPGTAQQIAIVWETVLRQRYVRNDRLTAPN